MIWLLIVAFVYLANGTFLVTLIEMREEFRLSVLDIAGWVLFWPLRLAWAALRGRKKPH